MKAFIIPKLINHYLPPSESSWIICVALLFTAPYTAKTPVFLPGFVPFSEAALPYSSQSAKTYDSPAVKSIFALLLEEVTRPEQAYPEGRNALKK